MMLRWQRLERDLGPEDGPTVELVTLADVPQHLPALHPVTTEEYAARIAARQRSVARRMITLSDALATPKPTTPRSRSATAAPC